MAMAMAMPMPVSHRPGQAALTLLQHCYGNAPALRKVPKHAAVSFQSLSLRLQLGRICDNGICGLSGGVFRVRCASKSAMRVLQEVDAASGTDAAKLLVRRSRGLSRVTQMEVLEELVHQGQCELVLPVYEAVRKEAKYKWDANLHARIVAMVSKDEQLLANSSQLLEPRETLNLKQRAQLECALIECYIIQGLMNQAHESFLRICELPLAKSRSLGYRALVRGYSAAEKPVEAEKMLMEWKLTGYLPSVDDYKALLLGYGKLGILSDMERIANDLQMKGMKLDTAGFNIMITAYCYAGRLERMVEIFQQMDEAGVRPSLVSWNALTKACRVLAGVGLETSGAMASPQTLCSRLYDEGASFEELSIVQLLLARGLPSECVVFSSDVWQLDLHNMSLGTASIMLPLWLSSLRDRFQLNHKPPLEVKLITGWGKHSKADVKAPVRKKIMAELEVLKSPFKADSDNRGALITRGHLLKKWLSTLPSQRNCLL